MVLPCLLPVATGNVPSSKAYIPVFPLTFLVTSLIFVFSVTILRSPWHLFYPINLDPFLRVTFYRSHVALRIPMYPVPRISATHAPRLGHVAESDRRQVPQHRFTHILPYMLLPRIGDVAESDRRQVPPCHFHPATYPPTTH